jgi:hypothetical protein
LAMESRGCGGWPPTWTPPSSTSSGCWPRPALRLAGGRTIGDRLISLPDPDARPIRKGKLQHPTQFGSTALIVEDDHSIGRCCVAHSTSRRNTRPSQRRSFMDDLRVTAFAEPCPQTLGPPLSATRSFRRAAWPAAQLSAAGQPVVSPMTVISDRLSDGKVSRLSAKSSWMLGQASTWPRWNIQVATRSQSPLPWHPRDRGDAARLRC